MEKQQFEALVAEAIRELPTEFRHMLDNVDVAVQDWASTEQLSRAKLRQRMNLLGLYEGVPLTKRGSAYEMVLPDRITLFQKPIEAKCSSIDKAKQEIQRVLYHEIGHHFGMDEKRLQRIESQRRRRRNL